MRMQVDTPSPIPIRPPLTELLTHVIEGGGAPRDPAWPGIREFAGFVGTHPSTVAQVIEDLRRSGYRPLHPPGTVPPSSVSGGPLATGAPAETVKGTSYGGAMNSAEEDES